MNRYNEIYYNETCYNGWIGLYLRVKAIITSQYRKVKVLTSQYRKVKVITSGG